MEDDLARVVRHLARSRWPFRLHATYDESISRFLDVFEWVDREIPFQGLRFTIDHAETISPRNVDRVRALGGGVAIQHRLAFQGERFAERYGREAAANAPPVERLLAAGVPLGLGTDATRVASYNPWVALRWLVSGRTVGGLDLREGKGERDRTAALRLMTRGSAWFSGEEGEKGAIAEGFLADLAVLSEDYFAAPAARIAEIESVLTIVGGEIVHGSAEFARLAPPLPPPATPVRAGAPPPPPVARGERRGCPCGAF
jgi:predicted amidohydrolase YtcJ